MLPTASEKALRALVAELAEVTPEDIAAVLAMLDARSRATVQSLLAAYTHFDGVFDLEIPAPTMNVSGLSDWLAARVLGKAENDDYHITLKTADVLRDIAASLPLPSSSNGGHAWRFDGGDA